MIIEAGYDVLTLLWPEVRKDAESKRALWVLNLDAELHFLSLRKACKDMTKPIEAYVREIRKVLTSDFRPVRYYVLAHTTPEIRIRHDGWLHDIDESLSRVPALIDHHLLGQVVFDPKGYYSTVPRYSFRDYPGLADLPRSASFAGPHPFGCQCPACEKFERTLAENRTQTQLKGA